MIQAGVGRISKHISPRSYITYWNQLSYLTGIHQHEKWSPPADQHDTKGQFIPSTHRTDGLLQVSLPGFPTPLDQRVMDTLKELAEFPFMEDMNSGSTLGVGKSSSCVTPATLLTWLSQQAGHRVRLVVAQGVAQQWHIWVPNSLRGLTYMSLSLLKLRNFSKPIHTMVSQSFTVLSSLQIRKVRPGLQIPQSLFKPHKQALKMLWQIRKLFCLLGPSAPPTFFCFPGLVTTTI